MDGERVRAEKAEISNSKSEIRNKGEIRNGKIQNGPHPGPLPKGEGTSGNGPHPGPLPKGEGTSGSPHPDPLPKGEGTSGSPHPDPLPKGEGTISPQYVTFVNPEPRKGVHVFARIAEVLSRRRPDIPLLIVEGAGKASFLPQLGIDLGGIRNLRIMPNTPDSRQFYAVTKLLLMPSLMENAGFVAMEAMTNGIPVLASNRGGLPETIGNSPHPNPLPAGEGTFAHTLISRARGDFPLCSHARRGDKWRLPVRHPGPLHAGDARGAHGRGSRALGRDDHPPLGGPGRVRALEPGGAATCPALASRPVSARLSRVLQPSDASARPSAGSAGNRAQHRLVGKAHQRIQCRRGQGRCTFPSGERLRRPSHREHREA